MVQHSLGEVSCQKEYPEAENTVRCLAKSPTPERGYPYSTLRMGSDGEFGESPDGEYRERSEGRASFGPGDRDRSGQSWGNSHGGKEVRLRNVIWFLAVFSALTAVSVYLDRAWVRLRKKKIRSLQ